MRKMTKAIVGILTVGAIAVLPACGSKGADGTGDGDATQATQQATDEVDEDDLPQLEPVPEDESDPTEFVGTVREVADPSAETVAPIELHSDDSRIVLQSVDTEESTERLRLVFEHDGDSVTGIKSYVDYGTVSLAQEVAAEIDPATDEDVLSVSVEGSCVVIEQAPETYEGLTVAMLEETYPDMQRI